MNIDDLITFINESYQHVFIEAEARPRRMCTFINNYNETYGQAIDINTDGIICLEKNANKWGLELRLYLHDITNMPSEYRAITTHNDSYRDEYCYRINSNDIIGELFEHGYRIGIN